MAPISENRVQPESTMRRKIITGRSYVVAEAAALLLMTAIASHTAIQIQAAPPVPSRTTANLEHVVIGVRDLAVATTSYERLGFTVTPGGSHPSGGTKGSGIFFSNGTYLELLTFYDREKAADLAKFLRNGRVPAVSHSRYPRRLQSAIHSMRLVSKVPNRGKANGSPPLL